MDTLVPRRRALLSAALTTLAAVAFAACLGRDTGPVGVSDKLYGGRAARGAGGAGEGEPVDGADALPLDYRARFTKVNTSRFVSRGHASGRWEADVWANEAAAAALAARAREVPVGAIVVQEHYELSDGSPGPVMMMEKRAPGYAEEHGDYRWLVVSSRGKVVQDGVIASCAGCHDDAPMDGFFPIVD